MQFFEYFDVSNGDKNNFSYHNKMGYFKTTKTE